MGCTTTTTMSTRRSKCGRCKSDAAYVSLVGINIIVMRWWWENREVHVKPPLILDINKYNRERERELISAVRVVLIPAYVAPQRERENFIHKNMMTRLENRFFTFLYKFRVDWSVVSDLKVSVSSLTRVDRRDDVKRSRPPFHHPSLAPLHQHLLIIIINFNFFLLLPFYYYYYL